MDHGLQLQKIFNSLFKQRHLTFFLMEELGEFNELFDSAWIGFELEVDITDIPGEGLGAFENFLGYGGDNGFILLVVDFLDLCFEGLYS